MRSFERLSFRTMLITLVLFFVATLGGLVALSETTAQADRLSALVDNVAGRQPMLVQRYLVEALLVSQGVPADPDDTRDQLVSTAAALVGGGKVLAVQGNDAEVVIPAPGDPAVLAKLRQEQHLIDQYVPIVEHLRGARPDTADYRATVNQAVNLSHLVGNVAHDAVGKATAVAQARSTTAANEVRLLAAVGALLGGLLGALVVRSVLRQLGGIAVIYRRLADGDLSARLPERGAAELARMARDLNTMVDHLRTGVGAMTTAADGLATSSATLTETSADAQRAADSSAADLIRAAGAAESARGSAEAMAIGVDQVRKSTDEIARNAAAAREVAEQAVAATTTTTVTVERLGESSAEIGGVVSTITAIAAQTNLLALNATIEAARAGEAGKGFAVVAGEVKELADQTAQATGDITRRVGTIRADVTEAIEVTRRIAEVIDEIRSRQDAIAAAVDKQLGETSAIAERAGELVGRTEQIAGDLTALRAGADQTRGRAAEQDRAAAELAHLAGTLTSAVGNFQRG